VKEFIIYESELSDYLMNDYERAIPIVILLVIILLIFIFRKNIRNNKKIEKSIRYIVLLIITLTTSLFYLGNWLIQGMSIDKLPFHLCYLCNILCGIILIRPNKKIFDFLIFAGVMGGISSLISIDRSMSSKYLKYHYFMSAHLAIILVPIYFAAIYKWFINKRELIKAYIGLQAMGITMGIFNYIFKTDYFFVSFTSNIAAKGTVLEGLGQRYDYFVKLELLSFLYFIAWYLLLALLQVIVHRSQGTVNDDFQ
jgi:hypothetical integral membrane protein (TIGR02206 family)